MAFNGYRNFETWQFMLYFEDFICECLQEQQQEKDLKYNDVHEFVKYIINEMYNGADKNIIGSTFLNDVISDFLVKINIKEVVDNIAHALNIS